MGLWNFQTHCVRALEVPSTVTLSQALSISACLKQCCSWCDIVASADTSFLTESACEGWSGPQTWARAHKAAMETKQDLPDLYVSVCWIACILCLQLIPIWSLHSVCLQFIPIHNVKWLYYQILSNISKRKNTDVLRRDIDYQIQ